MEGANLTLKVRKDIMPFHTEIDTTKIMAASRMVATASGFVVQPNKAIVGKNAFAHESGIHQDGVLKNAETFEIMRPQDIGLADNALPMGKHSGRAAFRAKRLISEAQRALRIAISPGISAKLSHTLTRS